MFVTSTGRRRELMLHSRAVGHIDFLIISHQKLTFFWLKHDWINPTLADTTIRKSHSCNRSYCHPTLQFTARIKIDYRLMKLACRRVKKRTWRQQQQQQPHGFGHEKKSRWLWLSSSLELKTTAPCLVRTTTHRLSWTATSVRVFVSSWRMNKTSQQQILEQIRRCSSVSG